MEYNKKRKVDVFRIVTTCFCLALVVGVIIFGISVYQDIKGEAGSRNDVEVTVPRGSSASTIADILQENGIITSSFAYKAYTAFYPELPSYQYGKFMLNSHMSYDEIAYALQQPSEFATTLYFTFPEGTTVLRMAMMMVDGGMEFTVQEFMEACNEDYSESISFASLIESNNNTFCRLEGYLFPSSYEFYYYDSPQSVIRKMLRGFEDNIYTDELKQYLIDNDMSLQDFIILSSIVEKESPGDEEVRRNIASVFLNRLADGSPIKLLQTDTSTDWNGYPPGVIEYYYENFTDEEAPASMLNAYDTYAVQGMPAGAICNPGAATVSSVINANQTGYYYFVSAEDGTTYFAATLAEHEANIKRALG